MIDGPIDKKLAADNKVNRGKLLSNFLKQLNSKLSFIEKETEDVLDERDAQSLLIERIQYYVNMGTDLDGEASDASDARHALGHIAQELNEYAKHHLLGTYPPCITQITNDEVLLRDGTRVEIQRSSVNNEVRLRLIEPETT